MRQPITIEDYLNARWIAEPMRLFDCCLETDGAAALVVSSAEWARNCPNPPAYLLAVSQGMAYMTTGMTNYYKDDDFFRTDSSVSAKALYERAGVDGKDIDVAQLYDAFSTVVLLLLEDFFCGRGNGGPYIASGAIDYPNGEIPINTSGAGLSRGLPPRLQPHGRGGKADPGDVDLAGEGCRACRSTPPPPPCPPARSCLARTLSASGEHPDPLLLWRPLRNPPAGKHGWGLEVLPLLPTGED